MRQEKTNEARRLHPSEVHTQGDVLLWVKPMALSSTGCIAASEKANALQSGSMPATSGWIAS